MAMGVLHVTNMTISMLYPLLIKILIEKFGRGGAQIIITAIGANAIVAALLLRNSKFPFLSSVILSTCVTIIMCTSTQLTTQNFFSLL